MSAITGSWYQAEFHPSDLTSLVGGDRGTTPYTGLLSELFPVGKSRSLGRGDYERFYKLFFLNEGNAIEDAVAFFQTVRHIDQIRFAFEKVPGDTSVDSTTMPTGYDDVDFVAPVGLIDAEEVPLNPIPALTGELGFWLMQEIPEGLSPETGALATLRIAGDVAP